MKQLTYRETFIGDGYKTMLEDKYTDPLRDYLELTRIFARTVAAIGWPSDKPGGLVVVGETLTSHPFPSELVVLDVFESPDPQELLNHAVEAQVALKYKEAFADLSNGPMRRFLVQYNDIARGHKRKEVSLRPPAFWEEDGQIFHYLQAVKLMLATGDKHLHLESFQQIAAALGDINYDTMHMLKEENCPMLAALGYVVAFLQANPYVIEKPARKEKGGMWKPLDDSYSPLSETDRLMGWDPFRKGV